MRKWIVLGLLALVGACATDTPPPTAVPPPDPVAAAEPAAVPQAAPAAEGGASAKIWAHGAVDVTGPWHGLICYFWWGPHEQEKAAEDAVVKVAAGETERFHFPDIKSRSPEQCRVQIDVATSCARSSIIPGLIADGYVQIKPCPNPTPTPSPSPSPTPTPPVCVEEGPYVGDIVWSGVIEEGACPAELKANCTKPCHELGKQTTTWDCQGPTTKTVCRDVDCPKKSGCHVSNQGGPGDTNFNIVLTSSRPHLRHSQRFGFCPGDLFRDCSCAAALEAAEACGDPARGGFVCKDNR
jgi:hypothetical protein